MNDEEYRIWRRRLRFAGYLAIDAYSARNNGNSELAEELQARSDGFARGAEEIARRYQGRWVLTLPRPDDAIETEVVFRGKRGITTNIAEALDFGTYLEALAARAALPTGEYYSPEPLDYHLRHKRQNETD